jgi:hypothetical protein
MMPLQKGIIGWLEVTRERNKRSSSRRSSGKKTRNSKTRKDFRDKQRKSNRLHKLIKMNRKRWQHLRNNRKRMSSEKEKEKKEKLHRSKLIIQQLLRKIKENKNF